jgi:hypothetical protein
MAILNRVQIFAGMVAVLIPAQAWATEPSLTPVAYSSGEVSTASKAEPMGGNVLMDKVYLNYFATFHGASFKDLGSPYTVDATGKPSTHSGVNLDSELTAAYMFNSDFGVGPVVPFLLVPVFGQGIILGDVGIKAFDKKTVSYRGLSIYANAIIQAPTSKSSQDRGMTFALKTTPNVRYSFPASRFTVGAWTEAKAYFGVTTDKTFKLYGAPYVNYQLLSSLSLNLEYEAEAHRNVGDPYLNFTMYQTDLEPGFVWNITSHILINPYVQIFTTNQISSDHIALGAIISATLL